MQTTGLAGVYNSGAGSAGIMRALEQFDPERRVTWVAHELSDDHRQSLQSGTLAMVIDQDPDMQAFTALHYLVEQIEGTGGATSPGPVCQFHIYFAENLRDGEYLDASRDPTAPVVQASHLARETRSSLKT